MRQIHFSKREFLTSVGAAGLAAAVLAESPAAAKALRETEIDRIPVIDTHVHPVGRMLYSDVYRRQSEEFARLGVPAGDYPDKSAIEARSLGANRALIWDAPRRVGYLNYIAQTYKVAPTLEGFDSVVRRNIGSDAEFTAYITRILDRERINGLVLQAAEPSPAAPATLIPSNRMVWTTVASDYTRLAWSAERQLTSIGDITAAIDDVMEKSVAAGCRGFKIAASYYRPLAMSDVDAATAERAFARLRHSKPDRIGVRGQPVFDDPGLAQAQTAYEDYLFKHVYKTAGRVGRPAIIHTAVALHPSLRTDYNDPRPLYGVFTHPEILKAGTRFILIHGGFPAQDVVAGFISQFPHVFVDVSFYSKYPGAVLALYRSLLSIGASEKIMHGSDTNSVPEEIGYCATNTRAALALVLQEYRTAFRWQPSDIARMAENVLHRTAERQFDFPTA